MANSASMMALKLSTTLETQILASWPKLNASHYCIGLSGGVDSMVLLSIIYRLSQQLPKIHISALHVNHGISPQAKLWEQHCQSWCAQLNIPLQIHSLSCTKRPGMGLENSARQKRYAAYASSKAEVIVLGHHQNDLIETLLTQTMRGSSLHNLAAMHPLSQKHNHYFWRPLLPYPKETLVKYATELQLPYIEDESNLDLNYLRNFLRQQIIPQLLNYDDNLPQKLLNSIESLQGACALVDELAVMDLNWCSSITTAINTPLENHAVTPLYLPNLLKLSTKRQINLLNYWIKSQNLALPTQKRLAEFLRQITYAKAQTSPQLELMNSQPLTTTEGKPKKLGNPYLIRQNDHIFLKSKTA
jgi:tRNA(Ile)-lysidine synthase